MRLPPFGKQFQKIPPSGVRVAVGPGSWDFQHKHHVPIMVLPDDANPEDFCWPSDGCTALIHERGQYDDDRLRSMAEALLRAGSPSVDAIREALSSLKNNDDPRVFFYPEVMHVAA